MTSSGTYTFNPSFGELTLFAFNRCQIRPTSLTQEHMVDARLAANLMLLDWSNTGPNLWEIDLQTVTLVQGTSTYSVPTNTITMLDAYISNANGIVQPTDRIIIPISRTEYASYPNKAQQGFPTVFWYDRLIAPTVTLWPVPDGSTADAFLNYYRVKQVQDATYPAGTTMDMPARWLPAFAYGLAAALAVSWAPQLAQGLQMMADRFRANAADQDVEAGGFYISPMLSSYFRN